ncbi:TPA: hypothetical protein ACPIDV_004650 [Pseudomonas aeruginosa]
MRLVMTSGPATVVQVNNINVLDSKESTPLGEGVKVYQADDREVVLEGDFSGFHFYMIVTHTRFEILQNSVGVTTPESFRAEISMELEPGVHTSHIQNFHSLLVPLKYVSAARMGRQFDGFELALPRDTRRLLKCDLPLMSSRRLIKHPLIPLNIEYIGIAATGERTAQKRLGEGHEKLQELLARLHAHDSPRAVSLLLYRPGKLDDINWTFEETVEIFEACQIQKFKPTPLNSEHLNFPRNKTQLTDKLRSLGVSEIEIELQAPDGTAIHSIYAPTLAAKHQFIVPVPSIRKGSSK